MATLDAPGIDSFKMPQKPRCSEVQTLRLIGFAATLAVPASMGA